MNAYLFALAALLCLHATVSSQCSSWDNPELGPEYQDDAQCFPLAEKWIMVYRNYEVDPFLGNKTKCVSATGVGDFASDRSAVVFKYGEEEAEGMITLGSTDRYNVKNVMNIELNGYDGSASLVIAYRECLMCKILNNAYIDGNQKTAFSYWVAANKLGQIDSCCEFIYDLIAGTSPKYTIYDSTCKY